MSKQAEILLEDNKSLWSYSHPKEAIWLQFVKTDNLHLIKKSQIHGVLRYQERDFSFSYHSEDDPLQEAKERLDAFDLEGIEILFIYGVGLGYDYLAAKQWLEEDQKRRLVFLEDNLAVICRFFETEIATDLLKDPQVQLTYFKDIEGADDTFNQLFWHYHGQPFRLYPSLAYRQFRSRFFKELERRLCYDMQMKEDLLQEYLGYGAAFFRNFYTNVRVWDQALLGDHFFKKFKQVPAVICGAGPSLEKSLPILKQMKDRALIFGGSSSLNALLHAGIVPHFGVGIDPNAKQADRFKELPQLDFPFFYRQRLYPGALEQVKGPRLYVTGAGGYDIATWCEEKLGIESEEIEEGRNVVNFALEIAYRMGCNPIIFAGMDLGFADGKLYSPGVITAENKVEINTIDPHSLSPDVLQREDINGRPLYTLWKWISESEWVTDFAKEHPDVKLINATEGGLGFKNVDNLALKEVDKRYLTESYQLQSRIAEVLAQAEMPQVTRENVEELLELLKNSLERCLENLAVLLEENEKMRKTISSNGHIKQLQTARSALVEVELADEPAFNAILAIFNAVYSQVLDKDIKGLSDPATALTDKEKDLLRLDLNERKYTFLVQTAQVNLKLLELDLKDL